MQSLKMLDCSMQDVGNSRQSSQLLVWRATVRGMFGATRTVPLASALLIAINVSVGGKSRKCSVGLSSAVPLATSMSNPVGARSRPRAFAALVRKAAKDVVNECLRQHGAARL